MNYSYSGIILLVKFAKFWKCSAIPIQINVSNPNQSNTSKSGRILQQRHIGSRIVTLPGMHIIMWSVVVSPFL